MEKELNNISEDIVTFQKKHNLTDNELAFNVHITVERLHDFKSMESDPTPEEHALIKKYFNQHA